MTNSRRPKVAGAYWPSQFRFRGQRREYCAAQLFSLIPTTHHTHHHKTMKKLYTLIIGLCFAVASYAGSTDSSSANDYFCQVKSTQVFLSHLKELLPPKQGETNQELLFRYFRARKRDS
jgi:hypothetical protein